MRLQHLAEMAAKRLEAELDRQEDAVGGVMRLGEVAGGGGRTTAREAPVGEWLHGAHGRWLS